MTTSVTTNHKLMFTLAPRTDENLKATFGTPPKWSVASGGGKVKASKDGLRAIYEAGPKAEYAGVLVEGELDRGNKKGVQPVAHLINIEVAYETSGNFGVTTETSEANIPDELDPKKLTKEEAAEKAKEAKPEHLKA